jgi:lipoyl(octanoyl) transferase
MPDTASVQQQDQQLPALETLDWGRTAYAEALERQRERVSGRLEGRCGDALIFTEHEPVFTLGSRIGAEHHLVWREAELRERGIAVVRTNRGGDVTYHGPGQLVGYPIVSLERRRDLHGYLRTLEEVLIRALGGIGLAAHRRDGLTGVWMENRKIAALGVAVRRWVAWHGFALNVAADLEAFTGIVPCGIAASEGSVTSIEGELGRAVDMSEVKALIAVEFRGLFPEFLYSQDNAVR